MHCKQAKRVVDLTFDSSISSIIICNSVGCFIIQEANRVKQLNGNCGMVNDGDCKNSVV
jgi:hypothetical protein